MKITSSILLVMISILPIFNCNTETQFVLAEEQYVENRIGLMAQLAKDYIIKNNMNQSLAILVDMSIHSGKKRLFLWDFTLDTIIGSALVSHGCGDEPWSGDYTKTNPQFSNTPDSHKSSLGKYKVGDRGYSNFGIHINYKLHGLSKTNNNAYKRTIVFHSWKAVSDVETYPAGTPEGWGCPAVANSFLTDLDPILRHQDKPVLFWIFNNYKNVSHD